MRSVLALLMALALALPGFAADEAVERAARDAFAQELARCAAYYLVVAEAYRRHEESANARAYTAVATKLLDRAVEYGEEDTVMVHAKQAMRDFFHAAGSDLAGMPGLAAQYGPSCSLCYDYPDRVFESWREKMTRQ